MEIIFQGGGTTGFSIPVPSEATSASFLASSTFPPGTYDVIAGVSRQAGSGVLFTVNWSCCDARLSESGQLFATSPSVDLLAVAEINDDGECELNFAP